MRVLHDETNFGIGTLAFRFDWGDGRTDGEMKLVEISERARPERRG
jgi:hypothetical protein